MIELKPDLILLTGDSLERHCRPEVLDHLLALLNPDFPKAAIPGNHEYKSGVDKDVFRRIYAKHNGDLLVNESKDYYIRGHRMMITGLDDLIHGEDNIRKALQKAQDEQNYLVLLHSPLHQKSFLKKFDELKTIDYLDKAERIRYLFAGHNHGATEGR